MLYFFTNSFVQSFKKKCLVLDCIETICNNNNIVTGKGEQLTSDGEWLCMGPPRSDVRNDNAGQKTQTSWASK